MAVEALFTRDQQAVREFVGEVSLLRRIADDGESPGLLRFVDYLSGAIAEFGVAELHARQAERYAALEVRQDVVPFHEGQTAEHNETGLLNLRSARGQVDRFREDVEAFLGRWGDLGDLAGSADRLRERTRSHLARLEVSASDAEKMADALQPCFELARSGDARRLPDFLGEQVDELDRLRREPDRGTRENIPWWKVVGLVLAFGAVLWAFFKCGIFGCSADEAGLVAALGSIGAIIARFC